MKPYAELDCEYIADIQQELLEIINTSIPTNDSEGWVFLNPKKLISNASHVLRFFIERKLLIQDFSVTVLTKTMSMHIDTLPMVAKINIPVANTQGWTNQWYDITQQQLDNCEKKIDPLGFEVEDISGLELPALAQIENQDKIIVFNSRIPHSVIKNTPKKLPRLVASFTFRNQPMELLQ